MAQILSEFEETIEPLIPKDRAEEFKALVRNRLNGFETDMAELIGIVKSGQHKNGHAQAMRDALPHSDRGAAQRRD
jgi:hypothetical protein